MDLQSKIVYGRDRVEELFSKTAALPIIGGPLESLPPKEPSVVWVVDKISNVLQRVCIQIKNTPDLKRLLVLATDAEEVAALMKAEPYRFLFEHPAFHIAVIDPSIAPDVNIYREVFRPTDWDVSHNTQFLYSFRPEFGGSEEWLAQVRSLFHMIIIFHRDGLGSSAYTEDAFLGFRNMMRNLPRILRTPDLRNWQGLGRKKPAILVGAGPSAKAQMEFLANVQNEVVIIAADTMLKPLAKHGIRPHLLASIERAPEIIGLLDDPGQHPQSFLVASAVLESECFDAFHGPVSIYLTQLPISKWFPFSRSRMDTGHSCMGLAMGLASFLECDPIYLMGIDLCWSEEGESHMRDVPYLQKDFYVQQNKTLHKESFVTQNSQGKPVRSNLFWTAFKEQFEYWAKVAPSKIFNLSPSGLPLKGIPGVSFNNIKFDSRAENFDQKMGKKWAYHRGLEIKGEVEQFLLASEKILDGLSSLEKRCPKLSCKEIFDALEKTSFYHAILHPVLKADVFNLVQENETRAETSRELVIEYLSKISAIIADVRPKLSNLLLEQKRGVELF